MRSDAYGMTDPASARHVGSDRLSAGSRRSRYAGGVPAGLLACISGFITLTPDNGPFSWALARIWFCCGPGGPDNLPVRAGPITCDSRPHCLPGSDIEHARTYITFGGIPTGRPAHVQHGCLPPERQVTLTFGIHGIDPARSVAEGARKLESESWHLARTEC